MPVQYKLTQEALDLEITHNLSLHPRRATEQDAGFDLSACIDSPLKIYPGQVVKVPTGVCVWLGDELYYETFGSITYAGLYLPRSSVKGLQLTNTVGLLDSNYQHESFCKWRNIGEDVVTLNPGDRMVQLIVIPVYLDPWLEVEEFETETGRGTGDGSSGR